MLLDKPIHTARVGLEHAVCRWINKAEVAFSGPPESERAKLLVDIDGRRSEDFRKLAARNAPKQIHLPEPILRHDISLRFHHVFDGTCADVRHSPVIALDNHILLQSGKIRVAVELRQRPVDEMPEAGAYDHDDDADNDEQDAKQGSQAGSC